ncbi:MAG TPA: tetratricopeptide repeat protein [Pyrinomonadaceae bacterium]|nr:tetratricopeptide repeat protein [Pyrinomonadaceae bacterium]
MPKAYETLLYLVQNSGKVIEKDELMAAIWSDTVVEENNLTQNISALRRVFGEKPGERRFIVTVPGHGYKFVPEVREFAKDEKHRKEEKGREGEEETKAAESLPLNSEITEARSPKIADRKNRRFRNFVFVIFGVVVCGLAGFYFWRGNKQTAAEDSIKTVAVLPFKPLVAENRNESLELGMADTLISKLSGGEIIVRPLNAVRRYGSLEQDSLTAGRELGTQAVLDGTIQTSADRIRVTARLFRTADGKQLWSEQFDEKLTDIFTVQDSISERVAAALKNRFGGAVKKRSTDNVEAYQLYMKGRYHSMNLTRAETDKGIEYFQQAIALDPNYALAYVGLADTYLPMALTSGVPSGEVMPKAKAAALRALEIDETLPDAHVVLGLIHFWYDWDWQAAEKQYLLALENDPNSAEAHFGYAHLLSNTGQHEKALSEIRLARELNPVSLRTNALEGQILFFAGKSEEALDRLNQTIDLNPNFWLSQLFLSRVYTEKGMHAEAVAAARKAAEISGNSQSEAYRAYALARWGKASEARAVLDELLSLSQNQYVPPFNLAVAYNGLGEKGKALDYLEKGFAEKDLRMAFLKVEPYWNNLRAEPRFIALMKKMNFE